MRPRLAIGSVSFFLGLTFYTGGVSFTTTSSESRYEFFLPLSQLLSRPANILLSAKNVPVLVDFGFAEKYDLKSSTAFHSNLSYGTPEVTLLDKSVIGEFSLLR
jgi:hypothetical protein